MIIWGWRTRGVTMSRGAFFCPHCRDNRTYQLKRWQKWFTLYFIPIFKMEDYGEEYVECDKCKQKFHPGIVAQRPVNRNKSPLMAVKDQLLSGIPLHEVQKSLTAAGVDPEPAQMAVKLEVGSEAKTCPSCGFQYHPAIAQCSNCGGALG